MHFTFFNYFTSMLSSDSELEQSFTMTPVDWIRDPINVSGNILSHIPYSNALYIDLVQDNVAALPTSFANAYYSTPKVIGYFQ